MTPNEQVVYIGSKLRDLIESRITYGPDNDLMDDIDATYDEFLAADADEEVELDAQEDALNG